MTKITVERGHTLSPAESQRLSEEVVDSLVSAYGGSKQVLTGEVHYKHVSGSKGVLRYDDQVFSAEVKLSLLMRPMAKMIKSEISRQFDKHL